MNAELNQVMAECCEIRTKLPAHHSTALLADSVDMFGDAVVYGFSIYAIARGTIWQARVALLKGLIMAAFGVGVLIEVTHKLIAGVVPTAHVMSVVGLVALVANAVCLLFLSRHRGDDINMCLRRLFDVPPLRAASCRFRRTPSCSIQPSVGTGASSSSRAAAAICSGLGFSLTLG
jgi:hypothetical protein